MWMKLLSCFPCLNLNCNGMFWKVRDFDSEMQDGCHLAFLVLLWRCWRAAGHTERQLSGEEMSRRSWQTHWSWCRGPGLTQWCVTPPAAGLSVEHCGSIWCVHGLLVTVNWVWKCMLQGCNWSLVGACLQCVRASVSIKMKWNEVFYSKIIKQFFSRRRLGGWVFNVALIRQEELGVDSLP